MASDIGSMPEEGQTDANKTELPVISNYIVKLAGACNLNCSYCYMYNLGDTTYKSRPRLMSRETAEVSLDRIFSYSVRSGREKILVIPHGGEPLLVGKPWMRWFLETIRKQRPSGLTVDVAIQTNGTLLDEEWLDLFMEYGVHVGISLDGPEEWNDRFRVNFDGKGSYKQVRRAIDMLAARGYTGPRWGVLVVANCDYSSSAIFNHLVDIGVRNLDFLWPDYHHDRRPPWNPGAMAKYYIELFETWYQRGDPGIRIRWFNHLLKVFFGGHSGLDTIGPSPLQDAVIESDGSLEPLDMLRGCGNGFCQLGLNVHTHGVDDLVRTPVVQASIHNQALLPQECHACPIYSVCGGGWLPHRWGRGRGFSNPSVHCQDLLQVISHVAHRLKGDIDQACNEPASEGVHV